MIDPKLFHTPRKSSRLRNLAAACAIGLALAGCTTTRIKEAPPVHTEVYIPVTQACEVEQVELTELETAKGVPDDIFEAVKAILIDREVLLADRALLKAANTDPCPEVPIE